MSSLLNEAVVHGFDAANTAHRPADTNISVDGDTDLAQHWLDNTAHVSG